MTDPTDHKPGDILDPGNIDTDTEVLVTFRGRVVASNRYGTTIDVDRTNGLPERVHVPACPDVSITALGDHAVSVDRRRARIEAARKLNAVLHDPAAIAIAERSLPYLGAAADPRITLGTTMLDPAPRPVVACLIGSCRFVAAFGDASIRETRAGKIVMSGTSYDIPEDHPDAGFSAETREYAESCTQITRMKIDLADEVLVINVGGWVDEQTRLLIGHAEVTRKTVRYLEAGVDL